LQGNSYSKMCSKSLKSRPHLAKIVHKYFIEQNKNEKCNKFLPQVKIQLLEKLNKKNKNKNKSTN